jgi:hypothetical protein
MFTLSTGGFFAVGMVILGEFIIFSHGAYYTFIVDLLFSYI